MWNSFSSPVRHEQKILSVLEFWGYQALDVMDAVQLLHEKGYTAGSVSSKNVLCKPGTLPGGVLHVPGMAIRDQDEIRDPYCA